MANKVLVLFAHPFVHRSKVNKRLAKQIQEVPNVTFHDLYEAYPDFHINVEHEKKLLLEHDVIVFQHPFHWYNTPAIIKEWCDMVLEYGFAYGENGDALKNKYWVHAVTTGGGKEAYHSAGHNRFTVRQFLAPYEQSAHLCQMHFLEPFVVYGTHKLHPENDVPLHAKNFRQFIENLRDNDLSQNKGK